MISYWRRAHLKVAVLFAKLTMIKESSLQDGHCNAQNELRAQWLNDMVSVCAAVIVQEGRSTIKSSRCLIEQLLQAEDAHWHMRSVVHQMQPPRFSVNRAPAGFEFDVSHVDTTLNKKLADLRFTQDALNVALIGGLGPSRSIWPLRGVSLA